MKKLIIELSDERLITPSGLSLVGQLLGKSGFIKKCNTMKVDSKRSQSQIKNGDILLSYIGLLCQGKTAYEDICHPRDGKTVYVGSSWNDVSYTDFEGNSKTITMRIVYEVIERTMDKNGQFLILPDIECNTFWTNLDWNDDAVIKGYHAHGECEQYHSEIKTNMDVERLPSGKFETNELVLELTILAYNILRMIGQASLKSRRAPRSKHPVKRRRIRTVISNLIQIARHVTTHGRRVILALGRSLMTCASCFTTIF